MGYGIQSSYPRALEILEVETEGEKTMMATEVLEASRRDGRDSHGGAPTPRPGHGVKIVGTNPLHLQSLEVTGANHTGDTCSPYLGRGGTIPGTTTTNPLHPIVFPV